MPPTALTKFKIRLQVHSHWAPVWSSKDTAAREDLSIWALELDTTPLHKRSRTRVSLGHYAISGLEPPAKARSPPTLDIKDGAVGLLGSSSEYLEAVVEQLLPNPLRYRLVWYSVHHKPPLFIWRAVPPSGQFVALGMVATVSEEPPPVTALCCVPKLWCERVSAAPRFVWRDDGEGGSAGSIWATAGMDLMLCVQGHELPEGGEGSWCLREGRITTDTWLIAQ